MKKSKRKSSHSCSQRTPALLLISCLLSLQAHLIHSSSPIQISLPLPLASGPQPVTIKSGAGVSSNNNDVIGYIVVPYPGSTTGGVNEPRTELPAAAAAASLPVTPPYFSL